MTNYELVTTFTGKTFKFKKIPKYDILVDLPDQNNKVILAFLNSISSIACYIPDEDEVYHYAGDVNFHNSNGTQCINFHSRAFSEIIFNDAAVPIPKNNSAFCNLSIKLDVNKSKKWFENIGKTF